MNAIGIFLRGMAMGLADLVPGISGGTIAFISGIYNPLIDSLNELKALKVRWSFLVPLGAGMATSIASFSPIIASWLADPASKQLLYSVFFALIVFSIWQLRRSVTRPLFLLLGTLLGYSITLLPLGSMEPSSSFFDPRFIGGGALAICAMLLPGISGSFVLLVLGQYPIVLGATANLVVGLRGGHFETQSFFLLANLAFGIVCGALAFARVLDYTLKNHHDSTVSTLIGFMIGALPSIWPF